MVVRTRKLLKLPAKFLPLHPSLPACLRVGYQRSFKTGFDPGTIYKLRHLRSRNSIYRNQITIEDDILKIFKLMRSYQEDRNNEAHWSEAFFNFMTIIVKLFWFTIGPLVTMALANFYRKILDLAIVYRWQGGVLPLALDLPTHIVEGHPSDLFRWKIPAKLQTCFCNHPKTNSRSTCNSARDSACNTGRDSFKQKQSPTLIQNAKNSSISFVVVNKGLYIRFSYRKHHK